MSLRSLALSCAAVLVAPSVALADPVGDCINANEKAIKLYSDGKLTEALAENAKCAVAACPSSITQTCTSRADQINASLPTIVFEAKDDAGSDLVDVKITVDGVASSQSITSLFTLNPGAHKFAFAAAGKVSVEKTYALRQSEKGRRETLVLHDVAKATPPPQVEQPSVPPTTAPATPASTPTDTSTSPASGTGQRIAGGVIAGVGLIGGAIIGGIFVSMWNDAQNTIAANCPANTTDPAKCPDKQSPAYPSPAQQAGTKANSDALTDSYIFGTAFGVGGALIVAGVIVFFTAPKGGPSKTAWSLAPSVTTTKTGFQGLTLRGEF